MINLIETASDLINLLTKPITTYVQSKSSVYKLWIKYNIELFNSQSEFLSLGKSSFVKENIFDNTFFQNYNSFKSNINFSGPIRNKVMPSYDTFNCYVNLEKAMLDCYDIHDMEHDQYTEEQKQKLKKVKQSINACMRHEKNYSTANERSNLLLITFIFQYLNDFENKSININMWNYSLRTMNTSRKYFYLGIITVFSQLSWLSILSYNIIASWEPNYDKLILTITVLSSLISILYSFDTVQSFSNSCVFYRFTRQLYKDFPALRGNIPTLYWNFSADCVSNCVIPILMPFINFFIVLHSDSVLEAILNSMAIFFIIHIDEELYTRTTYENETEMKVYVKKVIATLYDYYTPTFTPNFSYEYETEHNKIFRLALQN